MSRLYAEPIRPPEHLNDVRRWIRVAERILNDISSELIMSPNVTHAEGAHPDGTVARAVELMAQLNHRNLMFYETSATPPPSRRVPAPDQGGP